MAATLAKRKRTTKRAGRKPSANGTGVGMIRRAIVAEMQRRKLTRRDIVNMTKIPVTPVFEFLREGRTDRGISLPHAEAIMSALGIGLMPPIKNQLTHS